MRHGFQFNFNFNFQFAVQIGLELPAAVKQRSHTSSPPRTSSHALFQGANSRARGSPAFLVEIEGSITRFAPSALDRGRALAKLLKRCGQSVEVTTIMRGSFVNLNRRTVQRFRQFANWSAGTLRMKIVICFCIIVTVTMLASRDSGGWEDESQVVAQLSVSSKGYTLLINTWKRYDLLKRSISHYASCGKIDSIHIVWSEPNPPSEGLKRFLSNIVTINSKKGRKVELKFDIHKEDSLNNRFKEIKDLTTDAVFSIDDDIIFPCPSVDFAFTVWRSAPDTMVGFVPRMHWIDETNDITRQFAYKGWWFVWWRGTYSMVLTKAAFFHKKYLSLYTNEMPSSIKDYITKNRNCEDIAMSFLVANATGSPPIWVQGKIYEIGSTGISSLGGHTEKRSECINRFAAEFKRMPLVPTSLKAVDGRASWFW